MGKINWIFLWKIALLTFLMRLKYMYVIDTYDDLKKKERLPFRLTCYIKQIWPVKCWFIISSEILQFPRRSNWGFTCWLRRNYKKTKQTDGKPLIWFFSMLIGKINGKDIPYFLYSAFKESSVVILLHLKKEQKTAISITDVSRNEKHFEKEESTQLT